MEIEISNKIKSLKKILEKAKNIVIFGHVNPDGDAMGSTLGLFNYLKNSSKNPQVVIPNEFPDFLKWMPGASEVNIFEQNDEKVKGIIEHADLLIICDFNDLKRLSKLNKFVETQNVSKVMIDHHPQPTDFADICFSDVSVSSASELVFEVLQQLSGNKFIDTNVADCLLTGIITDTGVFNHNSETPRTYEIMAELIRLGGNKQKVIDNVYNTNTLNRLRLLGNNLLNGMSYYPQFASAFIVLSKADQQKFDYQFGDTEGHVNIPLSIKDVNFSALFIEKDEYIKISFRSKDPFDVNLFARKYYHGGGHKNAAGGKSYKPLNKTIDEFVHLLEKHKEELLNGLS